MSIPQSLIQSISRLSSVANTLKSMYKTSLDPLLIALRTNPIRIFYAEESNSSCDVVAHLTRLASVLSKMTRLPGLYAQRTRNNSASNPLSVTQITGRLLRTDGRYATLVGPNLGCNCLLSRQKTSNGWHTAFPCQPFSDPMVNHCELC